MVLGLGAVGIRDDMAVHERVGLATADRRIKWAVAADITRGRQLRLRDCSDLSSRTR